jgi:hypothetical protein
MRGSAGPIEALGHGDESDAVVLQRLDVVQAVHQGAAERSNFYTRRHSNFLAVASAISRFSPGRLDLAPLITSS